MTTTTDEATVHAALSPLMGLALLGERVAARTYALMGRLDDRYADLMRKFARMEGQHAKWFRQVCVDNDVTIDREFAERELGYLVDQVDDHFEAEDFDALAVLQGFIVESLAIATYEPFLAVAHRYHGAEDAFARALADEHYHVDWVVRYFRLRFFDAEDEFVALTQRVNVQGIDCIGGTMMNIADFLDEIGLSGADCAGTMMDGYAELLERVGVESTEATRNVVSMFLPLIRKYRTAREAP